MQENRLPSSTSLANSIQKLGTPSFHTDRKFRAPPANTSSLTRSKVSPPNSTTAPLPPSSPASRRASSNRPRRPLSPIGTTTAGAAPSRDLQFHGRGQFQGPTPNL